MFLMKILFICANILFLPHLILQHRLSRWRLWLCSALMHHLIQVTKSFVACHGQCWAPKNCWNIISLDLSCDNDSPNFNFSIIQENEWCQSSHLQHIPELRARDIYSSQCSSGLYLIHDDDDDDGDTNKNNKFKIKINFVILF